jgi:hypothetical protein
MPGASSSGTLTLRRGDHDWQRGDNPHRRYFTLKRPAPRRAQTIISIGLELDVAVGG